MHLALRFINENMGHPPIGISLAIVVPVPVPVPVPVAQAALILVNVPLDLIGGILALAISGQYLSEIRGQVLPRASGGKRQDLVSMFAFMFWRRIRTLAVHRDSDSLKHRQCCFEFFPAHVL